MRTLAAEQFEPRAMLAIDVIAAFADSAEPFYFRDVDVGLPHLGSAPQQITLRFNAGKELAADTLDGIQVFRSGGANDAFGDLGAFDDVVVTPGSIGVDDTPNSNQVIIRFAEALPDDLYRIQITELLSSTSGEQASASAIDFRIDRGAQVVAVVPQPLIREAGRSLSQSRATIEVYFNANDPLDRASVETVGFYRLIQVDANGNDASPPLNPRSISYDSNSGRALLTFPADIPDDAVWRLEIGGEVGGPPGAAAAEATGDKSSFSTAQDLGLLNAAGAIVTGTIEPRRSIATPAGDLLFPTPVGTLDEPGHRDHAADSGSHGRPFARYDRATGITFVEYNFRSDIGVDPQGNPVQNVITETQRQRAREIFEHFSLVSGVRFVETEAAGLTVATGDLRALDPNTNPDAVAGLGGFPFALMNSLINWGESEYGGYWFNVAMHEIGHALGLAHSYDVPSVMGRALPGEPIYPGDYDINHLRQLYPANGTDIDVYKFAVASAGTLVAETFVARPGQPATSLLDSVLSLYREKADGRRELIARNDDYHGRDSLVRLGLEAGDYFLAVTSKGNTQFNLEVPQSGADGRTDGDYELRLGFTPATTVANTVVDTDGTPIDGDRNGEAGGTFRFWFTTAAVPNTIFVDKASPAAGSGSGSLADPFKNLDDALAAVVPGATRLIRIAGNAAGVDGEALPYQVGLDPAGRPLADGRSFNVPAGVTAVIDAGAVFKLRSAIIDVGSSSPIVSRAGAALQVLGTPASQVVFTSYHDDTIGGNSDGVGPAVSGGQWGGIVFRSDSDEPSKRAFVNTVGQADIRYAGGRVRVDAREESFAAIEVRDSRPSIAFNQITGSATAAIAATPDSFLETSDRVGLEVRGNRVVDNSINGLFLRIATDFGVPIDKLDVPARLTSTDIVHVIQENLVINGGAGGYVDRVTLQGRLVSGSTAVVDLPSTSALRVGMTVVADELPAGTTIASIEGPTAITLSTVADRSNPASLVSFTVAGTGFAGFARDAGRLAIDPGVIVKLEGSRIELERGISQLIAEGAPGRQGDSDGDTISGSRVIFTSLGDNRYGAGGSFDTNGNQADKFDRFSRPIDASGDLVASPTVGDWGGIVLLAGGSASIDTAYLAFGGGVTAVEGGFDAFNVIEVHQGDLRLANTRVEWNASGLAVSSRNGRGRNEPATVFLRGTQPAIVSNDFRSNYGSAISINANSLTDQVRPDPGRSTGPINRLHTTYANYGPLLRGNIFTTQMVPAGEAGSDFNIDIIADPALPANVLTAIDAAVAKWESVIVGDLSDVVQAGTEVLIDDILITVQAGLLGDDPSDGPGSTLANAGPRASRSATDENAYLPFEAAVGVDMNDIGDIEQLTSTMIHEFGHALGFTSVSRSLSLINGADYTGPNALREYRQFIPNAPAVPIETGGGAGTAYAHWDETTFGNELMTGFINGGINPLSRVTVGALEDMGYTVNYAAADEYVLPGFGATGPIPGGLNITNVITGVVVRGEEIAVESVWDDTDIVHVLRDEIVVQNFHSATGLRLQSRADESLVVKLAGGSAGFTAAGYGLDIDDRIGGTVQVIGHPGAPVVLTSLKDDGVGAGVDPLGRSITDTNGDGDASQPAPGDWRSLQFRSFSNDRNVAILTEAELSGTGGIDANGNVFDAEFLGVLAPNFAVGSNSWESAQEKSGDENRRLGFETHGVIAVDDPTDVDVYRIEGYAGSEVWIDLDKTASSLDGMVELLDAAGRVLARSVDSALESAVVPQEMQFDLIPASATTTYQLANAGIIAETLTGVIYDAAGPPVPIHAFSTDSNGDLVFEDWLNVPEISATVGTLDAANGRLTITYSDLLPTAIEVRYTHQSDAFSASLLGDALPPGKDAWRGGDYFSTNPKDPAMRVVLPGVVGTKTQYYIRVRSQPRQDAATLAGFPGATPVDQYENSLRSATFAVPGDPSAGATSGSYQLRVRLGQRDDKAGSTVRHADIRYPTIGLDVQGLPRNSLLVGDAGESATANDSFDAAQNIGNLLQSDRATISVAGEIASEGDIDWFTFAVNFEQLQSIAGINDTMPAWGTLFDIDYADGFRGDLTISVFDESGTLLYVGRDSDVADDQPGPAQGTDFDDLSRGSLGKLDPFIGLVDLPAGGPTGGGGIESGDDVTPPDPETQLRYYVAVSSNERLPDQLDATFRFNPSNTLVRLEPISAIKRVVEDHIGATGYIAPGGVLVDQTTVDDEAVATPMIALDELDAHITPFTLSDVTLFVSTAATLETVDAMRGGVETRIREGYESLGEIGIRSDGVLFAYRGVPGSSVTAGRFGILDSGTGAEGTTVNDGITDPQTATEINISPDQDGGTLVGITTFSLQQQLLQVPPLATVTGTVRFQIPDPLNPGQNRNSDWDFSANADGTLAVTPVVIDPGLPALRGGTIDFINGTLSFPWSQNVDPANVLIVDITYDFTDQSLASDEVDAFAWRRTGTAAYDRLFYSVRDPNLGQSVLFTARPDTWSPAFAAGQPWGLNGEIADPTGAVTLGFTTGMAYVDGDLYGVDTTGHLFTIDVTTGDAANIVQIAGAPVFQGLANGPQNLDGGRYADLLFAIDADGDLRAFDTAGNLQTLFDAVDAAGNPGADGVPDATSIPSGVANATGLTFSPLDVNLWHPTPRRRDDAGHGINPAPDGSRAEEAGGLSMRFGFDGVNALHGVNSPTWQADLAANPDIGINYNLPGGAYGSLTTNPFSLEGYAYTDKPTLYFNYLLNTENARGTVADQLMRDSARVLVSIDGGVNWGLLATNNFDVGGELPGFASVSSRISQAPNQRVQELFDTSNWRQARIDLGDFAGLQDIRLRFDFNTAGMFDADQFWAASTTVAANAAATPLVSVDTTVSLATGLYVFGAGVPLGTTVTAVDSDAGTITLSRDVTVTAGDSLTFRRSVIVREAVAATATDQLVLTDSSGLKPNQVVEAAGVPPGTTVLAVAPDPADPTLFVVTLSQAATLSVGEPVAFYSALNDIVEDVFNPDNPGTANATGDFGSAERGQNNDFEGFYVDDIIVGFAERGEMVTAADPNATDFFDLGTPDEPTQVLRGPYQLEIRGATRDTAAGRTLLPADSVPRTFDTNDRLVGSLGRLGDDNHPREQGQFLIDSNVISMAAAYGISVDAADRDPLTGSPRPGVARAVPTLNNGRLAPGTVVVNNLINDSGIAGIRFSGDPNTAQGPRAIVPFGRIINNTLYGGDQPRGIGIEVTENAGPTLLNNLFANLDSGITVDGTSRADAARNLRTVIGASSYFNVGAMVPGGVTQTWPLILTAAPFVDALAGNFYPAAGSRVIDSGLDVMQDRNEFLVVNAPLGISPAPIVSPAFDLYGQLRSDDPAQASLPGFGNNVYKDRGAIDRADFLQPFATLVVPADGSDKDRDPLPDAVRFEREDARAVTAFSLQLDDLGIGIDPATVVDEAFAMSRNGIPLVEGEDYFFRYLETSRRAVFESSVVFTPAAYTITATTRQAMLDETGVMLNGLLTDLANNPLLPNKLDGTISFDIQLADVPGMPSEFVARADEEEVGLAWSAPAANGLPITRYEVQQRERGEIGWLDVGGLALTTTEFAASGLVNGTAYEFRVRAHNDVGPGPWATLAEPVTPGMILLLQLASDTGLSNVDGVTNDARVTVSNIPTDASWEISVNGGVTWQEGSGESLVLPEGIYPAGVIQTRFTLGGVTSEPALHPDVWVIDLTPPVSEIMSVTALAEDGAEPLPSGSTTSQTSFTVEGISEPGSTIVLSSASLLLSEFIVDSMGNWIVEQVNLLDGSYSLAVTAVDVAGNVGPASSPAWTITVDAIAPAAPVISDIIDDTGPITGSLVPGSATDDSTPVITGIAEPGVTVTVSDGGINLGSTVADTVTGAWQLSLGPLVNGSYAFTASVTDAGGNVSEPSAAYPISIDTTPPGPVRITGIRDDVSPDIGNVPQGGVTNDRTPLVLGTAEAGSTVVVSSSGLILGSTTTDATGFWSFQTASLANGEYILTAIAADSAGNASGPSDSYTVRVEAAEPAGNEIVMDVEGGQTLFSSTVHTGSEVIVKVGDGTLVLDRVNNHTGGLIIEAGEVVVRSVGALNAGPLTIAAGARLTLDTGTARVEVSSLLLDPAGQIDLGAGGLTIAAGGAHVSALRAALVDGRNGGSWDGGVGITSALAPKTSGGAVGYAVQPDGVVFVALTVIGDTDLDGRVNVLDLVSIDASGRFGSSEEASWSQGDFDYNGRTNAFDLIAIDAGGAFGAIAGATAEMDQPETSGVSLSDADPFDAQRRTHLTAAQLAFASLAAESEEEDAVYTNKRGS